MTGDTCHNAAREACPFDSPAIVGARSREMVDVLLDAGADINARSRWCPWIPRS